VGDVQKCNAPASYLIARHTPSPSIPQPVVERILALRDEPPAHLRRVPGPRTLLALLHRDPEALALALPLPRSSRTVWQVLRRSGRIEADLPHVHQPLVPPAPLEEVQADVRHEVASQEWLNLYFNPGQCPMPVLASPLNTSNGAG
jgi:hypothetical protein